MEGKLRSVEKIVLQLSILTQKNILLKKKVSSTTRKSSDGGRDSITILKA